MAQFSDTALLQFQLPSFRFSKELILVPHLC